MKKVVALVLVAMLVLGALGTALSLVFLGGEEEQPRPLSVTKVGRDGTLRPFMEQQIGWTTCDSLECAWLQVPVDHANPDGKRINLALVKRPASAKKKGNLVVNPGGPGAPGTGMAVQAQYVFDSSVTDAYDVIGFDPRGTGRSRPVDCLSDDELDAYIASDPTPDTPAEVAASERTTAGFAEGCRALTGELLERVSTVDAARDMDILRSALGDEQLNFHGASYGTALGATYADLFPQQVGRFVLDAGMDPTVSALEASLAQAEGFETALRAYAADCLEAKSCPLSGSVDDAVAQVGDLLDEIDAEPITGDGERKLHAGQAFYGIALPLYQEDYWTLLTAALKPAFKGDGAQLLELADMYSSRGKNGYTDNSMEAIGVINCLDDPWSVTAQQVPDYFDRFEKASPTFGRTFAWGLMACGGFGFEQPEPRDYAAQGAAPILVTATTRDPATPYRWGKALAEKISSGVLVSRDGDGHGAYNVGNDCVDDIVNAYLLDGTVPDGDVSC